MVRPKTKDELLAASTENYQKLMAFIEEMDQVTQETAFDLDEAFLDMNKEQHWARDQNLRDILIHLYEWQQMQLKWIKANIQGSAQTFLPEPYNWRSYGQLNYEFVKKNQKTTLKKAKDLLENSHKQVMKLAESFSNEELFTKGYFSWTGTSSLGAYFVSNLSSHYEWAMKKLKKIMKYNQSK